MGYVRTDSRFGFYRSPPCHHVDGGARADICVGRRATRWLRLGSPERASRPCRACSAAVPVGVATEAADLTRDLARTSAAAVRAAWKMARPKPTPAPRYC